VLPKAWGLLVKSFHTVRAVTGAFQSYADVGRMNEPQLDEFLADCPLQEWQKKELKNAHDKNKYYQGAIFGIAWAKHEPPRGGQHYIYAQMEFLSHLA
jgi:hypothetical protein